MDKVSNQRIEEALATLADLTVTEDLDGKARDDIGRVRSTLWEILELHDEMAAR